MMPTSLTDGAVCQRQYDRARLKIVHLLKQGVTSQADGSGSLVQMIQAELRRNHLDRMWRVCARRSYCIANAFPPWDQIKRTEDTALILALKQSAVVNAIKSTGGTRTTDRDLRLAIPGYAPRLRRELGELMPDLVVYGGTSTFAILLNALSDGRASVETAEEGMRYGLVDGVLYVGAYHPSYMRYGRLSQADEYEYFRRSVKAITATELRHAI